MGVQWGKLVNDLSQADQAASDGFDFVQPGSDLVSRLVDEQFLAQWGGGRERPIPFTVCEVPLPSNVRVTQAGFNLYVWTEHLKNVMSRMAALGCRKLVWSNGRARVLPPEGEVSVFKEQVLQFLFMLCELAGRYEMRVLVEPLGPRRTNFLNTMAEMGEFLARVGKQNLSALISLRELEPLGLSLGDLPRYRELIDHVQMENPRFIEGPRICPKPDDGLDYHPFVAALKGIGYSEQISLPLDADEATLAYCHRLWAE
jgi:hypothetical protein